jgi:hypothetical protein
MYTYGRETERVNLNTEGGDVLLLEFTSQMTLDEGGLQWIRSASMFDRCAQDVVGAVSPSSAWTDDAVVTKS